MAWTEGIQETGTLELAGREFPVSRVIREQKNRAIEFPGEHPVFGNFWELNRERGEEHNPAFVQIGNEWLTGHTITRRWTSGDGRPERQTLFISDDERLRIVVSSERITV